jgi:hypothetical protein
MRSDYRQLHRVTNARNSSNSSGWVFGPRAATRQERRRLTPGCDYSKRRNSGRESAPARPASPRKSAPRALAMPKAGRRQALAADRHRRMPAWPETGHAGSWGPPSAGNARKLGVPKRWPCPEARPCRKLAMPEAGRRQALAMPETRRPQRAGLAEGAAESRPCRKLDAAVRPVPAQSRARWRVRTRWLIPSYSRRAETGAAESRHPRKLATPQMATPQTRHAANSPRRKLATPQTGHAAQWPGRRQWLAIRTVSAASVGRPSGHCRWSAALSGRSGVCR